MARGSAPPLSVNPDFGADDDKQGDDEEEDDDFDDVVFETELIKQAEINVDYILMLVEKWRV